MLDIYSDVVWVIDVRNEGCHIVEIKMINLQRAEFKDAAG